MNVRPRISLSREGRYYLFVLVFIIGGAVLREVNLLVVLAALMMGPLLFSWRAVVMTLRRLTVRRRMPKRISAGDSLTVTILLANHRRRLPSWGMLVEDQVRGTTVPAGEDENRARVEVLLPKVSPYSESAAEYRLSLTRRGRYVLGPLRITTSFPFGFLQGMLVDEQPDSVIVCPRVGRLTRQWHERIESAQLGQQRSQRRRGLAEGDYYGLREWRPGDSRRWVHWRTSAKLGQLSVLQFEELRHRDLALAIDLWQPVDATDEDRGYVELAVSFAATAIIELGRRGGSDLAVAVSGAESECWTATASRVFAQEVLGHLATVRGSAHSDVSIARAALAPWVRRGARLLVISTRPSNDSWTNENPMGEGHGRQRWSSDELDWYNVRDEQLHRYFQVEVPKS